MLDIIYIKLKRVWVISADHQPVNRDAQLSNQTGHLTRAFALIGPAIAGKIDHFALTLRGVLGKTLKTRGSGPAWRQ